MKRKTKNQRTHYLLARAHSTFSKSLMVMIVALVVATGYLVVQYSRAAGNCAVSATLVNSCRPLLGAAVRGYPQAASAGMKDQALYHEKRIGRQLDLVHD